jgi:hypothetical protein
MASQFAERTGAGVGEGRVRARRGSAMDITLRQYESVDFKPISDFLTAHFLPGNLDGNWLQPAWEYMHSHPGLDESSLDRIGIWERAGEIAAVVHHESTLGEAFFQVHPDYAYLRSARSSKTWPFNRSPAGWQDCCSTTMGEQPILPFPVTLR